MGLFVFIISVAIVIVIFVVAVKSEKEADDNFQKSKQSPKGSDQKQIQSSNNIEQPKSAQTKNGFTVLEGYTVGKDSLIFEIAGINYKTKELSKISIENADWKLPDDELVKKYGNSTTIYRHSHILTPVQLIPEPTNKYDRNAIKVVVAGHHIGYVPEEHTSAVRGKMFENNGYYNAECFITDAEWKRIYRNEVRLHEDKYIEGWILLR